MKFMGYSIEDDVIYHHRPSDSSPSDDEEDEEEVDDENANEDGEDDALDDELDALPMETKPSHGAPGASSLMEFEIRMNR